MLATTFLSLPYHPLTSDPWISAAKATRTGSSCPPTTGMRTHRACGPWVWRTRATILTQVREWAAARLCLLDCACQAVSARLGTLFWLTYRYRSHNPEVFLERPCNGYFSTQQVLLPRGWLSPNHRYTVGQYGGGRLWPLAHSRCTTMGEVWIWPLVHSRYKVL